MHKSCSEDTDNFWGWMTYKCLTHKYNFVLFYRTPAQLNCVLHEMETRQSWVKCNMVKAQLYLRREGLVRLPEGWHRVEYSQQTHPRLLKLLPACPSCTQHANLSSYTLSVLKVMQHKLTSCFNMRAPCDMLSMSMHCKYLLNTAVSCPA